MSIEVEMIQRFKGVFNGKLWWDETPDNMTAADRVEPFGIMEIAGGSTREYVDQSEPEWITARVQVFVWGARSIAVGEAMRRFTAAVRASNDKDWIARPQTEAVGDSNSTLKLRGLRADFSITYRNPLYQG